jgi:hypothetical protein
VNNCAIFSPAGFTDMGLAADGSAKYAGETTACGKWRGAVAGRLDRNNFHCRLFSSRDWRRTMYERHAFGVVFNIVGALHSAAPAHEVAERSCVKHAI